MLRRRRGVELCAPLVPGLHLICHSGLRTSKQYYIYYTSGLYLHYALAAAGLWGYDLDGLQTSRQFYHYSSEDLRLHYALAAAGLWRFDLDGLQTSGQFYRAHLPCHRSPLRLLIVQE